VAVPPGAQVAAQHVQACAVVDDFACSRPGALERFVQRLAALRGDVAAAGVVGEQEARQRIEIGQACVCDFAGVRGVRGDRREREHEGKEQSHRERSAASAQGLSERR